MADLTLIPQNAPISPNVQACANQLGVSTPVRNDAASIEAGYKNFQTNGFSSNDPVIPRAVGHNGAVNTDNRTNVPKMIDCVGSRYQMDPAMIKELKLMYGDAVQLETEAHSMGLETARR